jgi:hypothetical protein
VPWLLATQRHTLCSYHGHLAHEILISRTQEQHTRTHGQRVRDPGACLHDVLLVGAGTCVTLTDHRHADIAKELFESQHPEDRGRLYEGEPRWAATPHPVQSAPAARATRTTGAPADAVSCHGARGAAQQPSIGNWQAMHAPAAGVCSAPTVSMHGHAPDLRLVRDTSLSLFRGGRGVVLRLHAGGPH